MKMAPCHSHDRECLDLIALYPKKYISGDRLPKKLLINASNLHIGGGVQVASSLVTELAKMESVLALDSFSVLISSEVDQNLRSAERGRKLSPTPFNLIKCDTSGFSSNSIPDSSDADVVFTVFGPLYKWFTPFKSIVGFAQSWVIYPDNECYGLLPFTHRLKARLKFWIQGQFFKRADVLVVELEHVKQGLVRVLGIPSERIHVIHNCISSIYLDDSMWQPVDLPKVDGYLRLGFLGRNYVHKNTAIFPAIVAELDRKHGIKARVYVTFTDAEWAACTPEFRAVCINVGQLTVAQCPSFYQALDAVVFPSLLECFSATPLESMVMEKPLFASDRPFNRDICGTHAHYFDPFLPASAAQAIARFFCFAPKNLAALRAAREHALQFSNPRDRAEKYLALMTGISNA